MAALNVVKRRLDEAGLGEACLELHSRAAKKKQVLEDLRRTCEQGHPGLREGRKEKLQELEFARRRLTDYAHAVNENIGREWHPSARRLRPLPRCGGAARRRSRARASRYRKLDGFAVHDVLSTCDRS